MSQPIIARQLGCVHDWQRKRHEKSCSKKKKKTWRRSNVKACAWETFPEDKSSLQLSHTQDSFQSHNASGQHTSLSVRSHTNSHGLFKGRCLHHTAWPNAKIDKYGARSQVTQWSACERCVIWYYWYRFSPAHSTKPWHFLPSPTKTKQNRKPDTWIKNLLIRCCIVRSTIPIYFLICPSSFLRSQLLREISSVVPVPLYLPAHSSCTFHPSENWKHRIVCSNPLLLMPTVLAVHAQHL